AVTPVTLCLFEKVFTFIIDLAVCKSTSDLGRAVCFFVVCEINIRKLIFIVNKKSYLNLRNLIFML
ncbi:hypothetical protein DIQ11_19310, partial [Acinetobacter baumannii]|nr:hypothetical protein [Acinetobacter baumannii]MUS39604.1 hypothetical protein [Acinetobacter baumannii]